MAGRCAPYGTASDDSFSWPVDTLVCMMHSDKLYRSTQVPPQKKQRSVASKWPLDGTWAGHAATRGLESDVELTATNQCAYCVSLCGRKCCHPVLCRRHNADSAISMLRNSSERFDPGSLSI